jgi:hypothetical protein
MGDDLPCDVKLSNWSQMLLKISLAGRSYYLDPWTVNVYGAGGTARLLYEPTLVAAAAALPAGASAAIYPEVSWGESIPGFYPLPLSVLRPPRT